MIVRWTFPALATLCALLLLSACSGSSDDPDGGSSDTGGPTGCALLDEAACAERSECEADFCLLCSCTPTFLACREAASTPGECPDTGCQQPECCGTDTDCSQNGAYCAPPGATRSCGACVDTPGDCSDDTDCGAGEICQPILCSCSAARACELGCRPETGCAPTDACSGRPLCPTGMRCDALEHPRCIAESCSESTDCPTDFDCDAGACARRSCQLDLDCEGVCVEGKCHGAYGSCELPVP